MLKCVPRLPPISAERLQREHKMMLGLLSKIEAEAGVRAESIGSSARRGDQSVAESFRWIQGESRNVLKAILSPNERGSHE